VGSLLVVTDNKNGFTYRAICNEIGKSGNSIIEATFEEDRISDYLSEVTLVFAVLSDEFDAGSIFFTSFKKKYAESDKKIVFYGSSEKITDVKAAGINDKIVATFIRPIENEVLVSKLVKIMDLIENPDQKKTILVVDDSGPMLRTVMGWLENNYTVLLANSAKTALDAINRKKPDLMLLDYEMPIVSGPQLLQMLREDENTSDIPVIFLTARSDTDSVKAVLALRPQGYILKTTATAALVIDKIEQYFRQ